MTTTRGRSGRTHSRFLPPERREGDDGFVLLESIISISLITVIMSALAMLFVTVIKVNNQQRARQAAVQIADSAVGTVRSLQPSDLVPGRTTTAVSAQWTAAPSIVTPWLQSMTQATDTSVATPVFPTTPTTQTINNIPYTVNTYLGWCSIDPASTSTACTTATSPTSVKYLRAVVAVSWVDGHCPPASSSNSTPTCVYVTSTLVSTVADPIFNLNEAPPAVPIIVNPGSQNSFAAGDTVSLQLNVQSGTGVPTYTWTMSAGSLPPGLAMNGAGLISGTITGTTGGTYSTTVQVTDGFARNANSPVTFTWTVYPALTTTNPGPQANVTGSAINPVAITPSGGSGTPYTWSDPGNTLPPGLSVSTLGNGQASITGTPTTPQASAYPVTLQVKDSSGRTTTVSFQWTISYPPLALSIPSNQTDTVNQQSPGLTLSASGGDGNYTFSGGNTLPAGLTLNTATGAITGTTTTLGTSTVTITVADGHGSTPQTVSFTWTVVARPTITTPAPTTTSVGAPVNLAVANTCPNTTCTWSISGQPTGLTINGSGVISGTVGGSAKTYTGIKVTLKDADGATVTTGTFNWTVVAAPTVSSPGAQVDTTAATISLQLTTTCSASPCTYALNNGPSGLSISNTGLITGKIGNAAGSTFNSASVTVTDAAGSTATTSTFTWTITAPPSITSPGDLTSRVGSPVSTTLTQTCADSPCTYKLNGGPAGVTFDAVNGIMNGTVGGTAKTYTGVTITVTDSDSISATTATFTWTVGVSASIAGTWPVMTTRNALPQQPLAYTCTNTGSKQCTITVTGLPTGIGISTTSGASAANSVTSVTVNQGSGIVYLNGKVGSAVTPKNYATSVSINGTTPGTDSGNWTVS